MKMEGSSSVKGLAHLALHDAFETFAMIKLLYIFYIFNFLCSLCLRLESILWTDEYSFFLSGYSFRSFKVRTEVVC